LRLDSQNGCDWSAARSLTGAPIDGEDALAFSVLENIRPMIETVPLEQAADAYARMMQGNSSRHLKYYSYNTASDNFRVADDTPGIVLLLAEGPAAYSFLAGPFWRVGEQ